MRKIFIAGGLAAAAVAAVIGAASTNSIDLTAGQKTVGYGSVAIDGANTTAIDYNVDPTVDDKLDSVTVTFDANLLGQTIQLGFGTAALAPCIDTDSTDGGTTTDSSGVVQSDGAGDTAVTELTCTFTSQSVTDATSLRMLVTGPGQSGS